MIYRVTVRKTGSVQPSSTFWNREVVHCGTDLEAARVEFLRHKGTDYGGSYGNSARETDLEAFESTPDIPDDDSAVNVDADT